MLQRCLACSALVADSMQAFAAADAAIASYLERMEVPL
jgi:hypothetical protein